MSHLKRLILLVFFCLLVACGQKGALVLPDKDSQKKDTQPSEQPAAETDAEKKETIE